MKNILWSAVLIALAIAFYPHSSIIAQKDKTIQPADTVKIGLSVNSDIIVVNPLACEAKRGDFIQFYTKDKSLTFSVIIENYDHFFEDSREPVMGQISYDRPMLLIIDQPPENNNARHYLVGIINPPVPIPLPPEAPPRIILNR